MHPAEAARQWREIWFEGLVAYQPAACWISLAPVRQALLRSAAGWGVQAHPGRVTRVRTGRRGDAQLLVGGHWRSYDAAVVVADSSARTELVGLPTLPDSGTVLSGEPIGSVLDWPSVVHRPGLPPDADGHRLPECEAEVNGGLIDLTLGDDVGRPAAAAQLWEYATKWLPEAIVNTTRARSVSRSTPRLDTSLGRVAVSSPLAARDRGLAPLAAAELAADLYNAIDLDAVVARAS